jgi:hypothetical protein
MFETMGWITSLFTAISAIATVVIAYGIFYSRKQLKLNQEIAELEFEYRLSKEYRNLIKLIPIKALLGEQLPDDEYQKVLVSRPKGFHLKPLAEPCVNLPIYTAPVIQPFLL